MYFFVNGKDKTVTCYKSKSAAATAGLGLIDVSVPHGADPVMLANQRLGDSVVIINVSAAFESVSMSDDYAAQELAGDFHRAIEAYYGNRS